MDEDNLNLSMRKFLKRVGIASQRHIEELVRQAAADGRSFPGGRIPVQMTLRLEGFEEPLLVEGEIEVS